MFTPALLGTARFVFRTSFLGTLSLLAGRSIFPPCFMFYLLNPMSQETPQLEFPYNRGGTVASIQTVI